MQTGRAFRIAPRLDVRQRAYDHAKGETRHFFAQLRAYQVMPEAGLLSIQPVALNVPVEHIVSRAGVRANCEMCGEEIINEREVVLGGHIFCHPCAFGGYYKLERSDIYNSTPHVIPACYKSGSHA